MKKIVAIIAIGVAFLDPVLASAACDFNNLPQSIRDSWDTMPQSQRLFYLNESNCGGGTSVPTPGNIQISPSGTTPGNIQIDGTTGLSANTQLKNPFKYSTFSEFAAGVTKTAVKVLFPFIVLAFIYSGFLFVKAQGNEKELEEAKKAIWYSIIGAFILLGSWGFANIIGATVGSLTI